MKREREEHSGSTTDGKKARPHPDDENGAKALASEEKPAPVVGEYDEDDDQPVSTLLKGSASGRVRQGHECPYLDSINRQLLDFDFEKCCSETLSHVNIYACLVCGKYYQGRAPKTVAFTHALESGHHMFMKLEDKKVYCLPDNYEVVDRSLDDIRHNLDPQFSAAEISGLDREVRWARALDGTEYQPGLVGLNNMKNTDYINVCLQMLLRISPVRDFFLRRENYAKVPSELVQRFGQLMRKVWNLRNFKGQVSPHELMQAIISESKKRFTIEQQSDPVEVWSWLLHTLHLHLTGGKPKKKSIITFCFQGQLEVTTEKYTGKARESSTDVVEKTTFLMLSMELPPMPLYKDAMERNFIPQVPIFNILTKYDGTTVTEDIKLGRRRFRILQLPRFLVLHPRRFTKNNFFVEKNKTIVNFPVKNLLLSECISVPKDASGRDRPSKYDLVANLVHQGENRNSGTYKVHIHRKSEDIWYEVQDLHIVDVLPQMVALSETFLQVYELKDDPPAQPAA